jgi:hypothetical protein
MHTIWKYELSIIGQQTLMLPLGSSLLHIGVQGGSPHVWFEIINSESPADTAWTFVTVGTGHEMPGGWLVHAGTYQVDLPSGQFVGHVFLKKD